MSVFDFSRHEKKKPKESIALKKGLRILVAGASGDIGVALLDLLSSNELKIGAHYYKNGECLKTYQGREETHKVIQGDITTQEKAFKLVDEFLNWSGGIDGLVVLNGGISQLVSWEHLAEADWLSDIKMNLLGPFFLVQRAFSHMRAKGGKIVMVSTASARHGASGMTMAYGVSKAGVESMVKGLAREGADSNILVNAVSPGFIDSKVQTEKLKRTENDLQHRASLTRMKRAGTVWEVAGVIAFLLSDYANYITGEVISINGGDWI